MFLAQLRSTFLREESVIRGNDMSADSYTKFSFILDLGNTANAYVEGLIEEIDEMSRDKDACGFSQISLDLSEKYDTYETLGVGVWVKENPNGDGLWIKSDEAAFVQVELLAVIIQKALVEYDVDQIVSFEWAYDCPEDVPGCFGGGAVVVSKNSFNMIDTGRFVAETEKKTGERNQSDSTFAIDIKPERVSSSFRAGRMSTWESLPYAPNSASR